MMFVVVDAFSFGTAAAGCADRVGMSLSVSGAAMLIYSLRVIKRV
jgi:hypothetical protein